MTTITLPPEPRAVPALVVDPGSIDDCAAQLLAASAQIDDLGTYITGGARIGDWSGRGGAAYHAAIGPIGRRADAMSLALRGSGPTGRAARHRDDRPRDAPGRPRRAVPVSGSADRPAAHARRWGGAGEVPGIQADCDRVRQQVQALDGDVTTWIADVAAEELEVSDGVPPGAGPRPGRPDLRRRGRPGRQRARRRLPRRSDSRARSTPGGMGSPPSSRRRSSRPARDRSAISTASRRRPATTPTRWPSTATSPSGACWRTGASSPTRSAGGSTTRGPPTGRWTPSSNASTPSPERRSGPALHLRPTAFDGDGAVAIPAATSTPPTTSRWWCRGSAPTGRARPTTPIVPQRSISRAATSTRTSPTPRCSGSATTPRTTSRGPARLGRPRCGHGVGRHGRRRATGRHDRRTARRPATANRPPHRDRPQLRLHHDRARRPRSRARDRRPGLRRQPRCRRRHLPCGRLRLDPEHVWSGANSRDPVTYLANDGWVNPSPWGRGPRRRPGGTTSAAPVSRPRPHPRRPTRPRPTRATSTTTPSRSTTSARSLTATRTASRGRPQPRPLVGRGPGSEARPRPDRTGHPMRPGARPWHSRVLAARPAPTRSYRGRASSRAAPERAADVRAVATPLAAARRPGRWTAGSAPLADAARAASRVSRRATAASTTATTPASKPARVKRVPTWTPWRLADAELGSRHRGSGRAASPAPHPGRRRGSFSELPAEATSCSSVPAALRRGARRLTSGRWEGRPDPEPLVR